MNREVVLSVKAMQQIADSPAYQVAKTNTKVASSAEILRRLRHIKNLEKIL